MAPRSVVYSPEQLFYAAACSFAERAGAPIRYVELFRDDVADPEAVDTLSDRDPGFRIRLDDLAQPVAFVAALAQAARRAHVWAQIVDQIPAPPAVVVPVRGTIS